MLTRGLRRDEAAPAGIERYPRRRELAHRQRRQLLDAVDAGQEGISQLAGHGNGVKVSRPDPGLCLDEGPGELFEAEAEWGGDLHGVDDAAVLRAGRFEVRAAHV